MARRLVVHAGVSKSGSSSLQASLRLNESVLRAHGLYLPPDLNSSAVTGDHAGFASSVGCLGDAADSRLHGFVDDLIGHEADTAVLSSEALSLPGVARSLIASGLFSRLTVKVVLYVRPHIGWFNSAWWQWHAWNADQGSSLSFVKETLRDGLVDWGGISEEWARVPGVSEVTIYPASIDPPRHFLYKILGVNGDPSAERVNPSAPESLLSLFTLFPELRPSPHQAAVEFDFLNAGGRDLTKLRPAPPAISMEDADELRRAWPSLAQRLRRFASPELREELLLNAEWYALDGVVRVTASAKPECEFHYDEIDVMWTIVDRMPASTGSRLAACLARM